MAPPRGLVLFQHSGRTFNLYRSRCHSTFAQAATDTTRKTQVYISRTLDPYINLSIEHFLLQKSPPDSTVLFLFTNRPCVVIGRNQNPWVEVNIGLLNKPKVAGTLDIDSVSLVRRRSGGGTVFHDEGNVNYSVICPTAAFDRDKHAQMVVRALERLGVKGAKVNERHDIVLNQGNGREHGAIESSTAESSAPAEAGHEPLKVSGSAYKFTRLRSLHHGTCLLSSPNIHQISQYLESPAKIYIEARGVSSTNSPITNVNVTNEVFEKAVVEEFGLMYESVEPFIVTDEASGIPEISKGLAEIKSLEWTYMQTPQFTFSIHALTYTSTKRPPLPDDFPPNTTLVFTARTGTIIEAELAIGENEDSPVKGKTILDTSSMMQKEIHRISDWQEIIPEPLINDKFSLSRWLNELFGISQR